MSNRPLVLIKSVGAHGSLTFVPYGDLLSLQPDLLMFTRALENPLVGGSFPASKVNDVANGNKSGLV